jgi:nucleotide-binding universal stress UspA family protein
MVADAVKPMVICYDGSRNAAYAIERAAGLLAGREALVVTVWQPAADLGGMVWSDAAANLDDFVELDRSAAQAGSRLAEEGASIARAAGVAAKPVAVRSIGPIWKSLVEFADRHDASVIVMGSRGLAGIRSLLLGSVSNAVAHHASQPTLVIHGDANGVAHRAQPGA